MKWTIRIELTPDGNPPFTCDIGTITRPIVDLSPEEIRLTLRCDADRPCSGPSAHPAWDPRRYSL